MDYFKSFVFGGILCLIGQILIDKTKLTPAKILVAYVVVGVVLGGLGIYRHFQDYACAGASIPLTGFGAALAKGVKDAVDTVGLIGILTGGLKACAGGITAAVTAALFAGLFFRAKDKS